MADHINISDPERNSIHWEHRLQVAKLEAELSVTKAERDHYRDNLDAVFTRIARGDDIRLHYRDGKRIDLSPPAPDTDRGEG